jgi:hypothetical protein
LGIGSLNHLFAVNQKYSFGSGALTHDDLLKIDFLEEKIIIVNVL